MADLDQLLVKHGIDIGYPERRAEKVAQLTAWGMAYDEVEDALDHIAATSEPASAPRIASALLVDRQRLERTIVDLEARRNARRASAVATKPDAPLDGEDKSVWEHDRMCRIVFCRMHGDRKTAAEVAAELGLRKGTVEAMFDRGRVLSASPLATPAPPKETKSLDETHEQRVARFREWIANKRKGNPVDSITSTR